MSSPWVLRMRIRPLGQCEILARSIAFQAVLAEDRPPLSLKALLSQRSVLIPVDPFASRRVFVALWELPRLMAESHVMDWWRMLVPSIMSDPSQGLWRMPPLF